MGAGSEGNLEPAIIMKSSLRNFKRIVYRIDKEYRILSLSGVMHITRAQHGRESFPADLHFLNSERGGCESPVQVEIVAYPIDPVQHFIGRAGNG